MSDFSTILQKITDETDTDFYLYSGAIDAAKAMQLVDLVESSENRTNAGLFLCTSGGDPDAAYTIAKCLKRRYAKFKLYIFGYCKSAGTLIALGADEIVMSAHGELGPLDVQLVKRDELLFSSSGLDLLQAMDSLKDRSLDIFENNFLEIIERSGGAITTKTAADIAGKLTGDFLSPVVAQIDPLRLGEVERALLIAYEYGKRLNKDEQKVQTLIRNYPSHSFVIDFEEASDIFGNVREPSDVEQQLKKLIAQELKQKFGRDCLRYPTKDSAVAKLSRPQQNNTDNNKPKEQNYENEQDSSGGQSDKNGGEPTSERSNDSANARSGEDEVVTEKVAATENFAESEEFRSQNGRG